MMKSSFIHKNNQPMGSFTTTAAPGKKQLQKSYAAVAAGLKEGEESQGGRGDDLRASTAHFLDHEPTLTHIASLAVSCGDDDATYYPEPSTRRLPPGRTMADVVRCAALAEATPTAAASEVIQPLERSHHHLLLHSGGSLGGVKKPWKNWGHQPIHTTTTTEVVVERKNTSRSVAKRGSSNSSSSSSSSSNDQQQQQQSVALNKGEPSTRRMPCGPYTTHEQLEFLFHLQQQQVGSNPPDSFWAYNSVDGYEEDPSEVFYHPLLGEEEEEDQGICLTLSQAVVPQQEECGGCCLLRSTDQDGGWMYRRSPYTMQVISQEYHEELKLLAEEEECAVQDALYCQRMGEDCPQDQEESFELQLEEEVSQDCSSLHPPIFEVAQQAEDEQVEGCETITTLKSLPLPADPRTTAPSPSAQAIFTPVLRLTSTGGEEAEPATGHSTPSSRTCSGANTPKSSDLGLGSVPVTPYRTPGPKEKLSYIEAVTVGSTPSTCRTQRQPSLVTPPTIRRDTKSNYLFPPPSPIAFDDEEEEEKKTTAEKEEEKNPIKKVWNTRE